MKNLGIIVGSEINDKACTMICQWAGWDYAHGC